MAIGTVAEQWKQVSWGAIFVGVVISMALMVLFTTLGMAIGAAAVDPLYDAAPLSGLGVGTGIYIVVTQVIALGAGGFAAARLAAAPDMLASLLHGGAVWAAATVILAWSAIAGGGAAFGAATNAVASTTRGAANAVESMVPQDFSFPDFSEVAARIDTADLPPELQQVLEDADVSVEELRTETRAAFRNVVSPEEQQRAMNILTAALMDALRTPGDTGSDVEDAFEELVGGENAVFSQEDRDQVLMELERRLGLEPEEVEQILQAAESRIATALTEVSETLDTMQRQALEVAQDATSAVATTALWLTIASLLGICASMGGAFVGRPDGPIWLD